jgi:hypothetical protein
MFQKWMIAFLADRGWRYLQNRQTRKKLQRSLNGRSKRAVKRAQQKREAQKQGFKPGRVLTLLALGAGAWAYFRSKQQASPNDSSSPNRYSAWKPDFNASNVNTSSAETSGASIAQPTSPATPEAAAPTYNMQARSDVPATPGDTTLVVEGDTLPADLQAAQAENAPTYDAQAALDQTDTLAVPTTHHTDDTSAQDSETLLADAGTLAVPATHHDASEQPQVTSGEAQAAGANVASDIQMIGSETNDDQKM